MLLQLLEGSCVEIQDPLQPTILADTLESLPLTISEAVLLYAHSHGTLSYGLPKHCFRSSIVVFETTLGATGDIYVQLENHQGEVEILEGCHIQLSILFADF